MATYKLHRTLVAVAIAQIFATAAVAAEDVATAGPPKSLAPGADSFLDARIGDSKETLRNSPVRDLSLSGGTRFGFGPKPADGSVTSYSDKPFSFVGSTSYYSDKRGIDDLEGGYVSTGSKPYSSIDQRDYSLTRNRYAFKKSLRDKHETMSSQLFTIGGKNLIGDTTVDYHIAHTQGADNRTSDYNSMFSNPTAAGGHLQRHLNYEQR